MDYSITTDLRSAPTHAIVLDTGKCRRWSYLYENVEKQAPEHVERDIEFYDAIEHIKTYIDSTRDTHDTVAIWFN